MENKAIQKILKHKTNWTFKEAAEIYNLSFNDLVFYAHTIFRKHFDPNKIQIAALLNIKQGACPENCSYCAQSSHFKTKLPSAPLMDIDSVIASAKRAKSLGASRLCMAAAWRGPNEQDIKSLSSMIQEVKKIGLETCISAGLLTEAQAKELKDAGLDFYNHNIDTSEDYYQQIITTRKFSDRIKTIKAVSQAGIAVCCGGIVGMGESKEDRIKMIITLANLKPQPKSVPINLLMKIPCTPLANIPDLDPLELVRTVATTKILLPKSYLRLAAGRANMTDELQALCFFAGANSIFYGEKLLSTPNPDPSKDEKLLKKLDLMKTNA